MGRHLRLEGGYYIACAGSAWAEFFSRQLRSGRVYVQVVVYLVAS